MSYGQVSDRWQICRTNQGKQESKGFGTRAQRGKHRKRKLERKSALPGGLFVPMRESMYTAETKKEVVML